MVYAYMDNVNVGGSKGLACNFSNSLSDLQGQYNADKAGYTGTAIPVHTDVQPIMSYTPSCAQMGYGGKPFAPGGNNGVRAAFASNINSHMVSQISKAFGKTTNALYNP